MSLHIDDLKSSIGSPARVFLWDVAIPSLKIASFQAQTSALPGVDSTDMELFYQGQAVKFPGSVEYSQEWTCEIAESEKGNVMTSLFGWRERVFNQKNGKAGDIETVKEDVVIKALKSSDGTAWLTYKLHGVYPKSIGEVSLDRSANTDILQWEIAFSYDWWEKI